MYKVEQMKSGRWALVASDGRTVHVFHSSFAAQTSADAMNRANYEPSQSPYAFAEGGCGRWDRVEVGK
jgi:hypothetical protein